MPSKQINLDLPADEKITPRSVWETHPELHSRYTFQQAMRIPALAICLRNEAIAKGKSNGR
jgi:hypothetical protein